MELRLRLLAILSMEVATAYLLSPFRNIRTGNHLRIDYPFLPLPSNQAILLHLTLTKARDFRSKTDILPETLFQRLRMIRLPIGISHQEVSAAVLTTLHRRTNFLSNRSLPSTLLKLPLIDSEALLSTPRTKPTLLLFLHKHSLHTMVDLTRDSRQVQSEEVVEGRTEDRRTED